MSAGPKPCGSIADLISGLADDRVRGMRTYLRTGQPIRGYDESGLALQSARVAATQVLK
jgi:hypothetical protein